MMKLQSIVEPIIITADGQMNSAGFCAKCCTYTANDYITKEALDMVNIDKIMTNFKSGNMKAAAFRKIMDNLKTSIIEESEQIIDAHSQISSIMKKEFINVNHNMDIWHAAKNLGKKIMAASTDKENIILKS